MMLMADDLVRLTLSLALLNLVEASLIERSERRTAIVFFSLVCALLMKRRHLLG
jgi:hypothetical protein